MELETVPGVGARTAEQLSALDDPERALREGDVTTIARAPNISEGRAARIARNAIRERHGDQAEFLQTDRARELYQSALSLLQERAVTDHARKHLETLYPSTSQSRIEEVRAFVAEAIDHEPGSAVLAALSDVSPIESPTNLRVRERCVATADAETYARAEQQFPALSVELVDDARDLSELARGYSTVIAVDEAFAGLDLGENVRVRPDAFDQIDEIVPERLLSFFATNRDRLRAAASVHEIAGLDPPCDLDTLDDCLDRLNGDGTIAGDEELARLQRALDDLDAVIATAERVANDQLRDAIQERDVTIEGADLLSLVEQGARVDSLLERELSEEFTEAVEAAREHLCETLAVEEYDAIAERVFPDEPAFPVERRPETVSQLRTELTAARDRRAERLKADLASELSVLRDPAETLVDQALELDVKLAVSRFTQEFDCTLPTINHDGTETGVHIEGGRSPLLDVPFHAVEPVEYTVEGNALLSGVNSGGKTSLIDLVGFVVILAQMGLPVPAVRARLERFDSLYYQAKSQGTLDAGAFEATLRSFGDLVAGTGNRLILVDELESITEPGASAKIIAGILGALDEQGATSVFVSHLAEEVQAAADIDVQIDGIQAVGLVDGQLEVNRSPVKGRLARSTPELIVEKLATDDETEHRFYERLLARFDDDTD
ncbi:MutS-related protein [Halocatena pleomorpha]|uniref:DNA-binding protein MutS2 n=1 Tax=Halocatena pleomorpha TaxID=1785090 RepID=A0A3P3RF55_9EURY|nr:endonuclease MutS2 [Halocatena pleomorpha]RRJ32156.1 endonuclease MutS2 [Halocatena pleomorpha]